VLTIKIQNSNNSARSHEQIESDGSVTAVVGLALDKDHEGGDYRLAQTLTDEYASHLS
jgi:hypothetical protein